MKFERKFLVLVIWFFICAFASIAGANAERFPEDLKYFVEGTWLAGLFLAAFGIVYCLIKIYRNEDKRAYFVLLTLFFACYAPIFVGYFLMLVFALTKFWPV